MKHRGSLIVGLLALCALIAILPLVTLQSEFGGADGEAEGVVSQLNPAYTPWAESILEPPGGETESLLFCLQAGIGAGILGFGFGYLVARKKFRKEAGTYRGQVR